MMYLYWKNHILEQTYQHHFGLQRKWFHTMEAERLLQHVFFCKVQTGHQRTKSWFPLPGQIC